MKDKNHISQEAWEAIRKMQRNTDQWIKDNNKALKRERINDALANKEIDAALDKLTVYKTNH